MVDDPDTRRVWSTCTSRRARPNRGCSVHLFTFLSKDDTIPIGRLEDWVRRPNGRAIAHPSFASVAGEIPNNRNRKDWVL